MNQLQLAFRIAQHEMGIRGTPGGQNTPRVLEYHRATKLKAVTDEVPWCSAFVNWCLIIAGILIAPIEFMAEMEKAGFAEADIFEFSNHANYFEARFFDIDFSSLKAQTPLMPTCSALARHFLEWGVSTTKPQEGDLVVLKRKGGDFSGHVGFYVSSNVGFIRVLGGNQHDEVCQSNFFKINLLGYRSLA